MTKFVQRIDQAIDNTRYRSRVAFEEGDRRLTFGEFISALNKIRKCIDVSEGKRVAALTRNRIEAVLLEWATYYEHGVWIGIPAREREAANVKQILKDFAPSYLLIEENAVDPLFRDFLLEGQDSQYEPIDVPKLSVAHLFPKSIFRFLRRKDPVVKRLPTANGEEVRRIRYTSGASDDRHPGEH